MLQDDGAVLEMPKQVFAATREFLHAFAFETGCEIRRHRPSKVAASNDDARQAMAFKVRLQAAADGFDFRKFGHNPAR